MPMSPSGIAAAPEKQLGFEPSPWGDFFIEYEPKPLQRSEQWMVKRAEKLKQDVHMMFTTCNSTTSRIILVDALQHLGIDHLFEEQIHHALREILENELTDSASLYEEALRFRLLREHGHWVSPEYEEEEGHNPILLELAKLDFNLLQHVHLKELKAITEWWKDIYGCIGLSYIRNRVVESYTWAYVIYHEGCFELPRIIIAKMMLLITILDDTYDTYATIEESRMLHEAVQRWDESAIPLLPEYLKKFYVELLRSFKNIDGEMPSDINYDIAHLKKAIQNNVTGYLQEAEWSHQNHKPRFIDHVNLTSRTVGAPAVCVSMMAGMGDAIMKQALEWTAGVPYVVVAAGKIVRFMNDVAAFEHGKCNRDVASSVECYINEYSVASDVAIAGINALIEDEWRTLNQARFGNRALLPALQRIIGLALSTSLIYDDRKDVYTDSGHLQKTIEGFFINPLY